jgi:hypothetical protein
MESCSFRPATAPSPFPSAPSSSFSSPRAPCPNLRFPVSTSFLRSYYPNFSIFFLIFWNKFLQRPRNGRQVGVRRRASGFDAFPPLPGKVFVDEVGSVVFLCPILISWIQIAFSWFVLFLFQETCPTLGATNVGNQLRWCGLCCVSSLRVPK